MHAYYMTSFINGFGAQLIKKYLTIRVNGLLMKPSRRLKGAMSCEYGK